MKKTILIIGAGPAGLTTAYQLLKQKPQDYNIIILEAQEQVGGISKTIEIENKYLVDTGIHRFFSKNQEVNDIWNEILPIQSKPAYDDIVLKRHKEFSENGSNPEKDEKSMLIKDRLTRIYYRRKFFDYPVTLNFDTIKKLGIVKVFKIAVTYIKACIIKKEEISLEDFFINHFGDELYKTFFKNYTKKVWGKDPSEISSDWGEQRVKGVSILEIIKDFFNKKFHRKKENNTQTSLIEQFYYPKLGAGQMWQEMAEKIKIMGGKIILNAKVVKINKSQDKITSVEYIENNQRKKIEAEIIISSMAIKDLFIAMGKDNENKKIYNLATKLPYRDFIIVYLLVDKLKLKNETKIPTIGNIIPDDWLYIQEDSVELGRIQIFNNWSPYLFKEKNELDKKVLISLEYFVSEGDKFWQKTEEEMIKFAEEEAINIDIIEKNSVELAKSVKIEKAYPSYFGTYKNKDEIKQYLNSIENLYCIGRNGQHCYNNMDHSMLTGIETANNIINNKKNRENIWDVNTEKEYHEIKNKER